MSFFPLDMLPEAIFAKPLFAIHASPPLLYFFEAVKASNGHLLAISSSSVIKP
jgi:hypothetical protein